MKKKYFAFLILFLLGHLCFSQTKIAESAINAPKAINTAVIPAAALPATAAGPLSSTAPVFARIPLPKNQKNSPAVFYIVNDTAVDYKTYLHSLRNTKVKK